MMGTVNTMTVMQREACCAQGSVGFCATTTKAPVIIHDKLLGVCQASHLSHFRTHLRSSEASAAEVLHQREDGIVNMHHPLYSKGRTGQKCSNAASANSRLIASEGDNTVIGHCSWSSVAQFTERATFVVKALLQVM